MDDPTKEFFRGFVEFMSTPRREETGPIKAMTPPDDNIPPLPRLEVGRDESGKWWCIYVGEVFSGSYYRTMEEAEEICRWLRAGGWFALNTARRDG